jgi:hypothetical protein
MPAPARIGDRDALEKALSPPLRAALDELCGALELPRDRWHRVPPLAALFGTAAVLGDVERRVSAGIPGPEATRAASDRLGISRETVESRLKRWFREAYRQ